MSSLDIWVGTVGKPCGSSTRLVPALLSLPILPVLHSLWVASSSPKSHLFPYMDSQLHSYILDTKLSWRCGQYVQWPDISSWMYPRHFNLNMFKTELFLLVVAPYSWVRPLSTWSQPARQHHTYIPGHGKCKEGVWGQRLPLTEWDLEFAAVAFVHFLWHWY